MLSQYWTIVKRRLTILRLIYIISISASIISLALHFRNSQKPTDTILVKIQNSQSNNVLDDTNWEMEIIKQNPDGQVEHEKVKIDSLNFKETGPKVDEKVAEKPAETSSQSQSKDSADSETSPPIVMPYLPPLETEEDFKAFIFNATLEKGYLELVNYLKQRIPQGEILFKMISSTMEKKPDDSLLKSITYYLIEPYYTKFRNYSLSYLTERYTKPAVNDFANITKMGALPGDIVEIDRHFYSHWAIYLNEKEVLNLYNLWNGNATIKVSTFDDLMGDDFIRVNNFELEGQKRGLKAFPREQVLANGFNMLNETFPYLIGVYNCEHFITEQIFGKGNGFSVEFEQSDPYIKRFTGNNSFLQKFV